MEWNLFQFNSEYFLTVVIRIFLSCILGGLIGFEREHSNNKPAGFRTHILVCMGSCLVVLISHFAITAYAGQANVDPTRIAGQVVSGIGFLGAGAILRHGLSVKGITTAASIWVVACVGLACGIGFYTGAILVTIIVWAVLWLLKYTEDLIAVRGKTKILKIEARDDLDIFLQLSSILKDNNLSFSSIDIYEVPKKSKQSIVIQLKNYDKSLDLALFLTKIRGIEGVLKVSL